MIRRERGGFWIILGPYAARFLYPGHGGYGFGYRLGDCRFTRWTRKWFSGWRRWDDDQ